MPRHYNHPMFSKRHYEAIAEILHEVGEFSQRRFGHAPWDGYHIWNQTIEALITQFINDNPRFDKEKFRKAVEGK